MVSKKETRAYRREIVQLLVWVSLAFAVLAIISYHATDGTIFHYASDGEGIRNWCGMLGATLAAGIFYLFGSASYLSLTVLVLPLTLYLRGTGEFSMLRVLLLSTGLMATVAMLGACYVLELHDIIAGGLVGDRLYALMHFLAGRTGSMLLLWSLVWVHVSLMLGVPLFPLLQRFAGILWERIAQVARGPLSYAAQLVAKVRQANHERVLAVFAKFRTSGQVAHNVVPEKTKELLAVPDEHADLLLAAGAVSGATATENFMPEAQEELPVAADGAGTAVAEPRLSAERRAELAKVPARSGSIMRHILKATYFTQPNTRLARNMFAPDTEGNVPYLSIIDQLDAQHLRAVPVVVPTRAPQEKVFKLPDARFFTVPKEQQATDEHAQAAARAEKIKEKLEHFGVKGTVVAIKPGPVVTMYEYKPDINSKISKILGLEDDLAMALTAQSMRIIAPIPGKDAVGFEIANVNRQSVFFSQLVAAPAYINSQAALPLILGVDVMGNFVIEDLATTPHLLVGGATGSGKSVGLNVMLLSMLCKRSPDDMKLILIDPKRLEFTPYADIPHLLFPIVTQPTRASAVLAWAVQEMERRYTAMAAAGVRNVHEYRRLGHPLPFLVIIIDELADLMMVAGKDVEMHIVRIAQMARAAGIHMIVATQRPSVDVVTGLIKVNFPSRVAYRVSSKIDSRTILDQPGAEKLLGKGDLLYLNAASSDLRRAHCPYVSDQEVEQVADFLRAQRKPEYIVLEEASLDRGPQQDVYEDELYGQVCDFVRNQDEISISMLQRQYRIGFNRSARLIEKMETDGLLAPAQGAKPRKVIR